MSTEKAQVGDIITVFFSILVGAFYFGQGGPNIQKLTEAKAVAAPIYDIIDRVFLATLYIIKINIIFFRNQLLTRVLMLGSYLITLNPVLS